MKETQEPLDEQEVLDEQEQTETTTGAQNEEKIIALEQQVEDLKDKYLRSMAEFENFKRRTAKERLDLIRTASQDILSALLPVLDDFDRAKKAAETLGKDGLGEGIELVYSKLNNILKAKGLTVMESTGEVFDPELHEAITEIPMPNDDMKGKVVDTVEKGYFLNEKIIRYAKVVVGK